MRKPNNNEYNIITQKERYAQASKYRANITCTLSP